MIVGFNIHKKGKGRNKMTPYEQYKNDSKKFIKWETKREIITNVLNLYTETIKEIMNGIEKENQKRETEYTDKILLYNELVDFVQVLASEPLTFTLANDTLNDMQINILKEQTSIKQQERTKREIIRNLNELDTTKIDEWQSFQNMIIELSQANDIINEKTKQLRLHKGYHIIMDFIVNGNCNKLNELF